MYTLLAPYPAPSTAYCPFVYVRYRNPSCTSPFPRGGLYIFPNSIWYRLDTFLNHWISRTKTHRKSPFEAKIFNIFRVDIHLLHMISRPPLGSPGSVTASRVPHHYPSFSSPSCRVLHVSSKVLHPFPPHLQGPCPALCHVTSHSYSMVSCTPALFQGFNLFPSGPTYTSSKVSQPGSRGFLWDSPLPSSGIL